MIRSLERELEAVRKNEEYRRVIRDCIEVQRITATILNIQPWY